MALRRLKNCTHALTVTGFFLIYGKCFHSVLRGPWPLREFGKLSGAKLQLHWAAAD